MKKRAITITLILCLLVGIVAAAFIMASRMKDNDLMSQEQSNESSIHALLEEVNEDQVAEISNDETAGVLDGLESVVQDGPEDYVPDYNLTPPKDYDDPDYVAPADQPFNLDIYILNDGPEDYMPDPELTPPKDYVDPDDDVVSGGSDSI